MTETYTELGATIVVADTDTNLFTVDASTTVVVGLFHVCNTGATTRTFRMAVVDGAIGTVSLKHYKFYDAEILGNRSAYFNIGLIMPTTYSMLVRASHAEVVFSAYGSELT